MKTSKIQKRALASAVTIALGVCAVPQISVADITLTFKDNAIPSSTPLPFSGPSANKAFNPDPVTGMNTEFRVMTPLGNKRNDGPKDAIFGGETWAFDIGGELIGTSMVANLGNPGVCNPPTLCFASITSGVSGFPICTTVSDPSCPVIEQGADFLSAGDFNFLAPVKGSIPGNTYGVATIAVNLTNNTLVTHFPVTHAQWANGNYIIGADPSATDGNTFVKGVGPGVDIADIGGITVTSAAGAVDITLDFVLHGESKMTGDEVTVPGFNQNTVQWELPGTATINNQNPVAVDDGSTAPIPAVSGSPTNFDVLANDTDPDHTLLSSTAFDTLAVSGVGTGACANGGTLTNNTTNVIYQSAALYTGPDSCTYTITDGRTGVSVPATIIVNVVPAGSNTPPTGNPDAGGSFQTRQGQAVSVDVLANDSDAQGDAITVSRVDVASASGGTVSIINGGVQGGNNVMFTPASGFNGVDSFTYDVTDVNSATTTGVTVQVQVASFAESSAGTVTVSSPRTAASIPVADPDTTSSCQGGCFDITVTGVPVGGQVEILLPKLSSAYVTGAELRHFVDSTQTWKAHEAPDSVQTAPEDSNTNLCPGLASAAWRTPTAGDACVKYTLTDNGPNDDDLTTPGTIVDPVGFGQATAAAVKQKSVISQGGCSLNSNANLTWRDSGHWLLLGAFIAILRLTRRKKVGVEGNYH